jgi:hypothetical protein
MHNSTIVSLMSTACFVFLFGVEEMIKLSEPFLARQEAKKKPAAASTQAATAAAEAAPAATEVAAAEKKEAAAERERV